MKTCLVLLAMVFASAIPAKAEQMTAGELAEECRPAVADNPPKTLMDSLSSGHCQGFVRGWMEMTHLPTVGEKDQIVLLNWKDGVKLGQVIRVYCLYIKQHPEKENEPAIAKLLEAAMKAELVEFKPWKP